MDVIMSFLKWRYEKSAIHNHAARSVEEGNLRNQKLLETNVPFSSGELNEKSSIKSDYMQNIL